jgi:hypothetical protein
MFPLLLIPLAICNIIVFLMPGLSLSAPLITLPLMSGASWPVTLSDVLLAFGVVLLLLEVMKARQPGAKYFTDHFLSLLVFGGAAAEFLLLPQFGTSTFFLLTLIALVDFLAGLALRVRRPRRVAAVAAVAPAPMQEPARVDPAPRYEPEPAPAPVVVPAAPVAEAAPLDHHEPKFETKAPEIVVHDPSPQPPSHQVSSPQPSSPQVSSPDLQPDNDAHPSRDIPPAR